MANNNANTEEKCASKNGEWTPYTCGEMHQFALANIPSSEETCPDVQRMYRDHCCEAGDAPPDNTGQNIVSFLVGLLLCGLKIGAPPNGMSKRTANTRLCRKKHVAMRDH